MSLSLVNNRQTVGQSGEAAANGTSVERHDVARSTAVAALARLGAVVEIVAQPIFTWLFGLATYGLYVVLWSMAKMGEKLFGLSLAHALQRVVPVEDEAGAHAAVKFAMIVTLIPSCAAAVLVGLFADSFASLVSVDPDDAAQLPRAIAIFAWALPLLVFAEVTTAAIRARRGFGPELRLRILWQQLARLAFAVGFFLAGFATTGLMLAHLASQLLIAILSVRLMGRFYDLSLFWRVPIPSRQGRAMLVSGAALMPSAIARRVLNDMPPIILNMMLPGVQGAMAAGLFGIARKVASIPLAVRQSFQYVLAPLSSAQAATDRAAIGPIYTFSVRTSVALVVPIGGILALLGSDILGLFAPGAEAALAMLLVLIAGRVGEAVIGPATPIVEMTGHRSLPLVNSLAGVATWAVIAWWLTPQWGALGMAIAVSAGAVVIAWAAAAELLASDRLQPFDGFFARGVLTGAAAIAALYLLGGLIEPFGASLRIPAFLLLLLPVCWLTLRLGLDAKERHALGAPARAMRLV